MTNFQTTLKTLLMRGKRYSTALSRFCFNSATLILLAYCVLCLSIFSGVVVSLDGKNLLTEVEQQELAFVQKEMKEAQAAYQVTLQATHGSSLKCEDAIAAVGNQRLAGVQKIIAERDYNAVLTSIRKAHSCENCELAKDGKSFVSLEGKR